MLMRIRYKRIYSTAKKLHWQAKLPTLAIVPIAISLQISWECLQKGQDPSQESIDGLLPLRFRTKHYNKCSCNKTNQMHSFLKFIFGNTAMVYTIVVCTVKNS